MMPCNVIPVKRVSRKPGQGSPAVDGILLLDKAVGLSSNRALQQVKRLFHASKAGHTGSLDPLASGLLPVCFGEATKLSQYLIDADKRYRTTFKLGQATTTGDVEGDVIQTAPVNISEQLLIDVLEDFTGPIEQVPPMYSALKKDGQPLYKLARKGIEVDRPARQVEVYSLALVEFHKDEVVLDIHCSKGFYVRSLAIDLGAKLGCGAHVTELRRTAAGKFKIDDAHAIADLEKLDDSQRMSLLLPVTDGLYNLPRANIGKPSVKDFRQGKIVALTRPENEGITAIYEENGSFIGIGEVTPHGEVKPKRLFHLPG
jgi:tRNA pseudouridine55 synthase